MSLFQPFNPDKHEPPRRRFRPVPIRILIPNMITLLALCAGLSAIRMAFEGRIDVAVYLIIVAAFCDMLDGRIARMIKGTSKFGAELDSLADFLSFGAVPVVVLYLWGMNQAGPIAWIAVLVFAICGALRLARFNVQSEDENRPAWMADFFTGVPIPAAAILVLLPIYLEHLLGTRAFLPPIVVVGYVAAIALLMVSRIPVYSGKKATAKVPREKVMPIFVAAIAFVAALVSYPWAVLALGTIAYLATLPVGILKARKMAAAEAAVVAQALANPVGPPDAAPKASDGKP